MLHSLLSIKDYTALGLDIIHIPDFFTLLLRFSMNMTYRGGDCPRPVLPHWHDEKTTCSPLC